jgi:hypothetical protein
MMKMKDLPAPEFDVPLGRRVYAVFWAPFSICWAAVAGCARFAKPAFILAAIGWALGMVLMHYTGHLSFYVGLGFTTYAVMAGAALSALLFALSLLGRLLRR